MSRLEKAVIAVKSSSTGDGCGSCDVRCRILVTVCYLCMMLSVAPADLARLILFALYPVLACAIDGVSYGRLFLRSCIVLPFVVLIGIFNPFYERTTIFTIAGVDISLGWITFTSIVVRGLLSMQALMILVGRHGFTAFCRGLRSLGIPRFLSTQLEFLHRYLGVLLMEALTMRRAREARGYGGNGLPLKSWGEFAGQLFIRTLGRAERINRAMLARGFNGSMPSWRGNEQSWRLSDTLMLIICCSAFVLLRFVNL